MTREQLASLIEEATREPIVASPTDSEALQLIEQKMIQMGRRLRPEASGWPGVESFRAWQRGIAAWIRTLDEANPMLRRVLHAYDAADLSTTPVAQFVAECQKHKTARKLNQVAFMLWSWGDDREVELAFHMNLLADVLHFEAYASESSAAAWAQYDLLLYQAVGVEPPAEGKR
jgi:hypothetical protein